MKNKPFNLIIAILLLVSVASAESVSMTHAANYFKRNGTFNGLFSNKSSKPKKYRKHRKHRKSSNRTKPKRIQKKKVAQNTPEIKIQKSLASLGFYQGKIDGDLNSYQTRAAIKTMHKTYNIQSTASLSPKIRDELTFLGDLFIFDKILTSRENTKKDKDKRIQAALIVHGFYNGKIDGAIGSTTKKCIIDYKKNKGLIPTDSTFDFEEEYQLLSAAKKINDKDLDETLASLKNSAIKKNTEIASQSTQVQ